MAVSALRPAISERRGERPQPAGGIWRPAGFRLASRDQRASLPCKAQPHLLMQTPVERPRAVTVFGVLNIVFAGLGLIGVISSAAMFASSATSDNSVIKIMRENPGYMLWNKIWIPLGLLTIAMLLTAGIGLLRLKPWARLLSVGYGIWAIVSSLAGLVVNYFFLVRPMVEEASRKAGAEAAGAIGGAVGAMFGGCIGMVYPILLLIFMTRSKVIQAFRPSSGAPPAIPPA